MFKKVNLFRKFKMRNETKKFIKNLSLATATSMLTGVAVSKGMGEVTNNGKIIGAVATASQYLSWFGVFLPLHASDNKEAYTNEMGNFDRKQFINDNLKFGASFLALDAAYLITRPLVQDYLIRKGIEPENSSWIADTMYIPLYALATTGIAKITGIIKNKDLTLEKRVSD